MERRIPVMSRKLSEMVREFLLIIRKGILKRKLMLDLSLRLQRDKISGNPIPSFHIIMPRRRRHDAAEDDDKSDNTGLDQTDMDIVYSDPESDIQMIESRKEVVMSPAPAIVELNYSGKPIMSLGTTEPVRQVRVTDYPYEAVDGEEDDVDKAAEEFIARFYREISERNAKKARG